MLLFGDTRQDGTWTEDRNSPETPAHTAKQVSQDGRTGQDFSGNSVNSYGDSLLSRCGLLQIGLYPDIPQRWTSFLLRVLRGQAIQGLNHPLD